MRRALLILFLSVTLQPSSARAQWEEEDVRMTGYLKTLPIHFFGTAGFPYSLPDGGTLDYTRLRIMTRSGPGGGLYMNTAFELEGFFGDIIGAGLVGQPVMYPKYFDFRHDVIREPNARVDFLIDRLNLEAWFSGLTVTAGRQRIAWGSGFFWNPTDIFNPFGPLALDPEDRTGVDGISIVRNLGTVSSVTLAHVVSDVPSYSDAYRERSATVLRAGTGLGDYDLSFLAAVDRRERTLGVDVSGYVGGAGVHLEAVQVRSPVRAGIVVPPGPYEPGDVIGWDTWEEVVLGVSHGLAGGWTIQAEWFHNGGGADRPGPAEYIRVLQGRLLAPGRDYGTLLVSRPLTPLLTASLLAMRNLGDDSGLAAPSLEWSATQDVRVAAGLQYFMGKGDSEFGALPAVGYLYLKYSF